MNIKNNATKMAKTIKIKAIKNSPELLLAAGTIGIIASAVIACKETLKVNDILDEAKENIEKIHDCQEMVKDGEVKEEKYTPDNAKKDLSTCYIQTGVKLVTLYSPAIVLGAASFAGIFASHHIMKQRNAALATAFAASANEFKKYRDRVISEYGEEAEHKIRYNLKSKEIIEETTDKKGKKKKEKKTVLEAGDNPNEYSEFARFFDEGSEHWEKNAEYNLAFLKAEQAYANDKLKVDGYLFLNDVYERLGIPETSIGQLVGWIYNEDNPVGDNFVDFGIYNTEREVVRNFVNGYEPVILLDFNVDGAVWDLI